MIGSVCRLTFFGPGVVGGLVVLADFMRVDNLKTFLESTDGRVVPMVMVMFSLYPKRAATCQCRLNGAIQFVHRRFFGEEGHCACLLHRLLVDAACLYR